MTILVVPNHRRSFDAALPVAAVGRRAGPDCARLLFAAFLINPAPVCVLDEVDAPLDDANLDPFCTLVGDIADTTGTRFLVVTHHRITMARVDRLFGLTMAERGISQLISVDLARAARLRQSA